jgi:hypothetical protein
VAADAALYPANQNPADWFNSSAFVAPPAYTYGNAGRNILAGPSTYNNDIGLQRYATFKERYLLQFTTQAFNLFNTPQFGLPKQQGWSATTGVNSTVVNPEWQLQLSLHLTS